jgi:DNA-binding transcriptional MerR regulator
MRIGDFARLGNVSVRTLRFYDQTGLLAARQVDVNTGYRHYDVQQLTDLRQIRAFQDLGFSLSQIRNVLRRELPASQLRALMEERRSEIKRHVREDLARLARIERLCAFGQADVFPAPITLQDTNATWIVSLREKLQRYDQAEEMFLELERKVPGHLLTAQRSAFWHACELDGGSIDCEVVRFLKQPVSLSRGMRVYRLPAATVASVFHCGRDETIGDSYKHLNSWLASSDFRLQRGPKREIYWLEPHAKNRMQAVTEIQYPVTRVAAKRGRAA